MKIEIWGKNDCVFCDKAVEAAKEYDTTVKKLDVDFEVEDFTNHFPYATTVPQIYVDEKHIGGYLELVEILKANTSPN